MQKKPTRHLILPTIIGALSLALAGCGGTSGGTADTSQSATGGTSEGPDQAISALLPQKIKDAGTIRLGVTTTNPPFSLKQDQKLVGLIPDLADEVGGTLGVKVDFVATAFPGLVPALQADRIDAIWTLLTDTAEREKTMNFVPYMHISSSLLVEMDNPKTIGTLDDLCGVNVATLRGAIQIGYLEEQSKKCVAEGKSEVTASLYDDSGTAQTQLRAGKVDAYFGFRAPLQYVAAKVENGNAFTVLDGKYEGGYLGIAVPKDQTELADALKGAVAKTVADGSYDSILKTHHVDDEALKADEVTVNGVTSGILK